jgi:hypothetical protein
MSGGTVRRAAAHTLWPEVWPRFAAALTVLLLWAGTAHAEAGKTWTFEVLEVVEIRRDEHMIRLRPRPPGRKFPRSCETFIVHSVFDLETWSPGSRRHVSRDGHHRSLLLLQQAQATRTIIRVGALGKGFGAIAESPRCEVASRALQTVVEDDGTSAVYSVFTEPQRPGPRLGHGP